MRSRWVALAIVVLTLPALRLTVAAQKPAPLRLISTAWPPFTDPAGQPRFALDLTEAALGRIGVTSKTTIVSNAQFTTTLLSGLFDGSAAVWKDAERERALIFSQPYLENRLVLVGRHGADVSARSLDALKGKKVAIVQGYSYGDAIDTAGPAWTRSSSEEDSIRQLLKGSVEYTLMDELVVTYIVTNYPTQSDSKLQIGSTPLLIRPLYFAVSRSRSDAQTLIDGFNAQLRGMIIDRTYHKLLHVDWILADINGSPEYIAGSDQVGKTAPGNVYRLFTAPEAADATRGQLPGFYFGGSVYTDWASVPDSYKTIDNANPPDPRRSSASIFKFVF